jgi:SpoVK/Ycf46/Vps4 family AAA+-type ATPase
MPRTFEIGLPDKEQREKILRLHLRNEALSKQFDFSILCIETAGYSGSDLKELCRAALMIPLREHLANVRSAHQTQFESEEAQEEPQMRPLSMADFEEAKYMVQPTGATAYAYQSAQQEQTARGKPEGIKMDQDVFAAIMAAGLQQMMHFSQQQQRQQNQRR